MGNREHDRQTGQEQRADEGVGPSAASLTTGRPSALKSLSQPERPGLTTKNKQTDRTSASRTEHAEKSHNASESSLRRVFRVMRFLWRRPVIAADSSCASCVRVREQPRHEIHDQ